MLRILTFNISGSNVSAHAPAGFGLLAKVQAVTDLVAQHQPHLLALQEVDAESPHIAEELAALLASLPAGGGYTLAASTPSHCGLSQVYAQAALRPSCGTAVGPVALCRIPLPLPSLAGGGGSAEDVGLATEEAVPAKEAAAGGAADQLSCFYFAGAWPGACTGLPGAGPGRKSMAAALPASHPYGLLYLQPAGCHLEPFADGAEERLLQVQLAWARRCPTAAASRACSSRRSPAPLPPGRRYAPCCGRCHRMQAWYWLGT